MKTWAKSSDPKGIIYNNNNYYFKQRGSLPLVFSLQVGEYIYSFLGLAGRELTSYSS